MAARPLAVLLVVLLPLASAGWGFQGAWEPSTSYDASGLMFGEPDTDPNPGVRKAYFNVVAVQPTQAMVSGSSTAGGVHPNVLPGSALAPVGAIELLGYLGVWKDCNGDGFVGMADGALQRYRVELLSDATVCPQGGEFNRDGWVWELIPLRPLDPKGASPRGDHDAQNAVWADFGAPSDPAARECSDYPAPRGTTASVGGLLGHVDCSTERRIARAVNEVDADGSLGLRFEDPEHPEGDCGSALRQPFFLFHDPYACEGDRVGVLEQGTGRPAFTVWDCSRPRGTYELRDPTAPEGQRGSLSSVRLPTGGVVNLADERGSFLSVPGIAPSADPDGSVQDGIERLEWGIAPGPFSVCRTSGYTAILTVLNVGLWVEHANGFTETPKRRTDFTFAFDAAGLARLEQPLLAAQPVVHAAWQALLGGADNSLGVSAIEQGLGGQWRSTGVVHSAPDYAGPLVRGDGAPNGPVWITAYAALGPASLSRVQLPAPSPFMYGAEACGGGDAGLGWDCDAGRWWDATLGGSAAPRGTFAATPGVAYHLRDVDCLDGDVGGTGVRASVGAFADTPGCA